jgi:hypothetical protein
MLGGEAIADEGIKISAGNPRMGRHKIDKMNL